MEPPYGVEESNNNFIIGEYTQQKQVIENATTEYAFADSEFTRRKVKFFVFFLFSMMCDILNCGVIGVIFQSRKIRHVSYLIANLGLASILISFAGCIYMGDNLKIFTNFRGVYLCGILSYIRNLLVSVIPLTVFAISHERIRALRSPIRHILIRRTLVFIWGVSGVAMLPTMFNRVYEDKPPIPPVCKKVSPFGLDTFAILFEFFRFVVFHASISVYMAYELYHIRSKMKYLYIFKTVPSERLLRKVQKVRFVYIFSITFMCIWIPFGFLLCFANMQYRISWPSSVFMYLNRFPNLAIYLWIAFHFYMLLVPIIVLLTNEDISILKIFFCMKVKSECVPENKVELHASEIPPDESNTNALFVSGQEETFEETSYTFSHPNPRIVITDTDSIE